VNSSLTFPASPMGNPTVDQIDNVIAAPCNETHIDPSPPAEPPPSPPDPDHYDIPHSDIPPGSVLDNIMRGPNCSWSPTTPFEFPFYTCLALRPTSPAIPGSTYDNPLPFPLPSASVFWVVVTPWVFGIKGNSRSTIQIKSTDWSLMDAGTNICLMGDLSILADAVDIPPLPITVALNGNSTSLDDCCPKKDYIPLTLSNGTIHWQLCYYSANAVETIISPQAILGSSDLFASWAMTGYKDNRPGAIFFDSHNGCIRMSIQLVCHDGLYYCLTNVFTLGHCPGLLG
jgi:hypothetical protein